jgi:hypothetical protein
MCVCVCVCVCVYQLHLRGQCTNIISQSGLGQHQQNNGAAETKN